MRVGPGTAGTGTLIQGLTSFQTPDFNYIVAVNGGKMWAFNGTAWVQIATGGIADNDDVFIARFGLINQPGSAGPPVIPPGYTAGTTVLAIDGMVGTVGIGEKLYFTTNLFTDFFEYTIHDQNGVIAGANTTQITLEQPGLVFDVQDDWGLVVLRPAKVNHPGGYPGGYTGAIAIDGYTGIAQTGEYFVVASENVQHKISAHTETGSGTSTATVSITDAVTPLQTDWAAADSNVPVVFAEGMDQLFFCDGVGPIYGWNGKNVRNFSSASLLDLLSGTYVAGQTTPPTACNILVWFQNRLIASGVSSAPDTVYFSDVLDPTSWDQNFQTTRIGGGESDPITGLIPWTDLNMLVTKKNSIYLVNCDPAQNPDPTDPTLLIASFAVKKIHGLIGCPAPWTACQVGGGSSSPGSDVFFMDGDKKMRSIRRVLAAETQQEIGDPISMPIQDYLDRCNIQYIQRATAIYHNDHYILAFPIDGATRPNAVAAYNLLTQTWCGEWNGWAPTCFARRTDLGSYTKLIFGQSSQTSGAHLISLPDTGGTVFQWFDDLAMEEETTASYQDNGIDFGTSILTRAITFGDPFMYKTGLNVEFEFDESVSPAVTIQVLLDKVPQAQLIAPPFSTLSAPSVRIPIVIPFTLGSSPSLLRMSFDLQRYGTWRELQFLITTTQGKLSMRSIRLTGFSDSIRLQSIPGMFTS
jgi:hypothetical protein